jgi:hypothetical protein
MYIKILPISFLSFLSFVVTHSQTTIHVDSARDIINKKTVVIKTANEIHGILAPIPNQTTQQYNIDAGVKVSFPASSFIDGIKGSDFPAVLCTNPKNPHDFNGVDNTLDISLKLLNGHILISTTVKDLKTGEIVGKIVDNKWVIKLAKKFNYASSSKYLEIIDNYGFVCLRIEVGKDNKIVIRGYFVGVYCSLFLTDHGLFVMPNNTEDYETQKIKKASELKPKHCTPLP